MNDERSLKRRIKKPHAFHELPCSQDRRCERFRKLGYVHERSQACANSVEVIV